jgi:conjugative transfer region protein TrbK
MRDRLLNLPAIARAVGFALVAIAIIVAMLHFRDPLPRVRHTAPAAGSDPLSDELKRCQLIANQATDDAACEAVWAERRSRFFTYSPRASAATPAESHDR